MTITASDSIVFGGQFYFFGCLDSTLRAIILGYYDASEEILTTQYIKAPVLLLKAICQVSEDQARISKTSSCGSYSHPDVADIAI